MGSMTNWEKRLRQRLATDKKRARELKQEIAAARLDGASFREIGGWTELNHETVRKICMEINGHTRTQADLTGDEGPPTDPPAATPEPTKPPAMES